MHNGEALTPEWVPQPLPASLPSQRSAACFVVCQELLSLPRSVATEGVGSLPFCSTKSPSVVARTRLSSTANTGQNSVQPKRCLVTEALAGQTHTTESQAFVVPPPPFSSPPHPRPHSGKAKQTLTPGLSASRLRKSQAHWSSGTDRGAGELGPRPAQCTSRRFVAFHHRATRRPERNYAQSFTQ